MRYQDFEACIFDFDGVIIDSEPLHAEAKPVTLDHFRVQYPDKLFADFKGRPDKGPKPKEHGPHLKLKNDWLMAEYLKRRVLERADVVMAPTINYN